MRNRDKRKLEAEHSGQVTGFTGFTQGWRGYTVVLGSSKDPSPSGNGNSSRDLYKAQSL
jgi:hypothetical protein